MKIPGKIPHNNDISQAPVRSGAQNKGAETGKAAFSVKTGAGAARTSPIPGSLTGIRAGAMKLPDLAAALRLPTSPLSEKIIQAAIRFNVPLETKTLQNIRKTVLEQQENYRPAAVMAAAAAADKGVALGQQALADYAEAIDPDAGNNQQGAEDGQRQNGERHSRQETDRRKTDRQAQSPGSTGAFGLGPEDIRGLGLSVLQQKPALELLNRFPGKNGRRYAVIPFRFTKNGVDINVSLRIDTACSSFSAASTLIADIVVSPAKTENGRRSGRRRWTIRLEHPASSDTVLSYSVEPVYGDKKLEQDLSQVFNMRVKNGIFPVFAELSDDLLRTVDKEV